MEDGAFVTILLTYESTEKLVKGLEDERFGWVIRINGFPQHYYTALAEFSHFVVAKEELTLTCFEEPLLSYDVHDQFHPPMGLVTKYLGIIVQKGYMNTSSSITAEKNEMTFCLWNFQKRC